MRQWLAGTIAVLALPALCFAATLAADNPALVAEVTARLALLPPTGGTATERKQRTALGRADAALALDATTIKTTVKNARKVATALGKGFPGDTTFGPLVAAMVSALRTALDGRVATLTAGRDGLPDGKTKTKLTKKIDKASAALASAASSTNPVTTLKLLGKVATQVVAGEAILGPGGGGPTTTMFTLDIGNPPTDHAMFPNTPAGALDHFTAVSSGTGGSGIFTFSGAADGTAGITYSLMFFVIGPVVGERPMATVGSSLTLIPGSASPLTSGTVTFTTYDRAQGKCEGTFSATFGSTVVSGTFSSIAMVVQ